MNGSLRLKTLPQTESALARSDPLKVDVTADELFEVDDEVDDDEDEDDVVESVVFPDRARLGWVAALVPSDELSSCPLPPQDAASEIDMITSINAATAARRGELWESSIFLIIERISSS